MNLSLFLVKIACLETPSLIYIVKVFMGNSALIYIITNKAADIRTIYNRTLGIAYIYIYLFIYLFIFNYMYIYTPTCVWYSLRVICELNYTCLRTGHSCSQKPYIIAPIPRYYNPEDHQKTEPTNRSQYSA